MLDGWAAQQVARNLAGSTVEKRRSVAIRFRAFADCYPWSWSALMVDEFFLELRSLKGASHSTVLGYQNALRMFLEYLTDPAYGWSEQCWERFGDHPAQVFHEWNTARHSQSAIGAPGKRPYTRDEIQDLFDCADDRVLRIRRAGSKGWIPAFRIATMMKAAYAWGLRRNEVRQLDLVDLASNPRARQFGDSGIVYVRFGKAMRGAPPKRRTVLTLPEFDWIVECMRQWKDEVRPLLAPPGSTALWPSERSGMLAADSVSRAFNSISTRCAAPTSRTWSKTATTHSSFSSRSATSTRQQHPSTPASPPITAPASSTTRSPGWPPNSPRRRPDPCNVESTTAGG